MTDAHDCDGEIDEGNDHDADVESPSETAASTEESRPAKTFRVSAEPPRWRFVADAKKSLGYSSLAAGQYVEGKTSEELGATYVAPEVWLHKAEPEREKLEVGKLRLSELPVYHEEYGAVRKEDVEVGKLDRSACEFVGDINVGGSGDALDATKEEGSTELKRDMVFGDDNEKGEWTAQNSFEEKDDGSTNCSEPNGETRSENLSSQNKGENHEEDDDSTNCSQRNGEEDHAATDSEPKKRRRHRFLYILILLILVLGVVLGVLLGTKNDGERGGSISPENAATVTDIVTTINHTSSPSPFPSTALTNEPSAMPSLPPSTGPTSISTPPSISQQPSESSVPSISISSQPSSSVLPTARCMPGTKVFWLEQAHDGSSSSAAQDWTNYPNAFEQELGEGSSSSEKEEATFRAIWKVKNACSEEVVEQCPPCSSDSLSLGSFAQTGLRSNQPLEIEKRGNKLAHHTKQKIVPRRQAPVENITMFKQFLCLPVNTAYRFEVQIAPSSQFCCAFPFDPHTVVLSYDDEVLSVEGRKTYFGESNMSC